MIERQWRSKNGRLKWSYFLDEDGKATEIMRQILRGKTGHGLESFVLAVLPHYVVYGGRDSNVFKHPPDSWMRENMKGAWTLWTFQCSDPTSEPYGAYYAFELDRDAVLFKITWVLDWN